MRTTPEQRLESWRRLQRDGGPQWLLNQAPRIIAELEAEIARLTPTIQEQTSWK